MSFAVLIPYWAKTCGIVSLHSEILQRCLCLCLEKAALDQQPGIHSPVIPSLEECAMQAAEESNYA